jgi:predicted transcriptional regulator
VKHHVWTLQFEETRTFTIAEPPFFRKSLEEVANELGWAVYRQGMSENAYRQGMQAYFFGKNQRVEDSWIKRWYAGAQAGRHGPREEDGSLPQKALISPVRYSSVHASGRPVLR